jgi:hypothetical protein
MSASEFPKAEGLRDRLQEKCRSSSDDAPDAAETAATAAYISELTFNLSALARAKGLRSLGYLLDMARLEAERIAVQPTDGSARP